MKFFSSTGVPLVLEAAVPLAGLAVRGGGRTPFFFCSARKYLLPPREKTRSEPMTMIWPYHPRRLHVVIESRPESRMKGDAE